MSDRFDRECEEDEETKKLKSDPPKGLQDQKERGEEEAEVIAPIPDSISLAMKTLETSLYVFDNVETLYEKKKRIRKEMEKIKNKMSEQGLNPELLTYERDEKRFAKDTRSVIEKRLKTEGHREKTEAIIHDKNAEIGSALETIINIVAPIETVKIFAKNSYTILPAIVSQTGLQLKLAGDTIVPNISEEQVRETLESRTSIAETSGDYKVIRKAERGLGAFILEDVKLLFVGLKEAALASFIAIPEIRLIAAVKEAAEACKNEKSIAALGLGVNVLVQAVCGMLNALVGVPETLFKASAAMDTRMFYFATGLLKGRSDLDEGDHELFDRVNWTVKNICRDNKAISVILGLVIGAGYFMTTFSAKQTLQADIAVPKNIIKFATKLLSAIASFRSWDFTKKELIQAGTALFELLPALMIPDNIYTAPDVRAEFRSRIHKLTSGTETLDPRSWSRIYQMFNSTTPISRTYQGWKNYLAHGWTSWVPQLLGAGTSRLAKNYVEEPFNKRVNAKWKIESKKRADSEVMAIIAPYQDMHAQYKALKKELDKCLDQISALEAANEVCLKVEEEKYPSSATADSKSLPPFPGSQPLQDYPASVDERKPHVSGVESSGLLSEFKQPEDNNPIREDADTEIDQVRDVVKASFKELITPERLKALSKQMNTPLQKVQIVMGALGELSRLSGVDLNNFADIEDKKLRYTFLSKQYEEVYREFNADNVAKAQFAKIDHKSAAAVASIGFYSSTGRHSPRSQQIGLTEVATSPSVFPPK